MIHLKYSLFLFVVFLLSNVCLASNIKLVNVKFQEPYAPKTEVNQAQNWYTNHFSVSGSYRIEIELDCQIPNNTTFSVRTYALIQSNKITLGDARIGRSTMSGRLFIMYDIFPSSLNYYGQCQFLVVVDADNEVTETDEISDNEWKFNATIHAAGERF